MKRHLIVLFFSLFAGVIAALAWFFVIVCGTGESHPAIIYVLEFSGVIIAGIAGFGLGRHLNDRLSVIPVTIGWVLALPFTPQAFSFMNPARRSGNDTVFLMVLLALFYSSGVAATILGARSWEKSDA